MGRHYVVHLPLYCGKTRCYPCAYLDEIHHGLHRCLLFPDCGAIVGTENTAKRLDVCKAAAKEEK